MTPLRRNDAPRVVPLIMTFYDSLRTYPYPSTFYIREGTPEAHINALIDAVRTISGCALATYKIGYRQFTVPGFDDRVSSVSNDVMGTFQWMIEYVNGMGLPRSHVIPGRKHEHTLGWLHPDKKRTANDPNLNHEDWKVFLDVFKAVCISSFGEKEKYHLKISRSDSSWPPSGWKNRK